MPAASRWPGSRTSPGHHELAASKYHGKILQSVLEEMGAEWMIHTSSPGVSYHGLGTTPIPESRHVIGTVRMGDDPDTSVVDRWGRVHSLDNVVVADSSVFVTSSGYGPTLDPGGPGGPGGPPPGGDHPRDPVRGLRPSLSTSG